jgi:molecular chaperone GrpE
METDVKAARESGVAKAVESLLPAYDAIERAKEHGDIPEGFAAIVKQLESAFAALGLAAVGEVGEAFDPNLHEAYGQDTVEDKAKDDTITAVLEKGWKQGERVIRPAKVRVGHFG